MSELATSHIGSAPPGAALAESLVCPAQLGKYLLRREIGRGGMGVVYEGEDTLLERTVAIKWLQPQGAQPLAMDRLLREARWAARLNHPNAVAVYDAGEHGTGVYIAMELVSGASAYEHLQQRGPFPWREATRIIAEVCQALTAAHNAGLIHRDIKPANILLVDSASPVGVPASANPPVDSLGFQPWAKLSDFGLSRSLDYSAPATVEGQVVGTPHYMSPEQIRGEQLDQRTDLYSLGATYYTLLTGRLPFERDDVIQVLFAHCSAAPPNPRTVDPQLPDACATIVARCLAKEPRDRYSSAAALLLDLQASLAGESSLPLIVTVKPSAAAQSALKQSRGVSTWGIGIALGALVTACCLIALGSYYWPANSQGSRPKSELQRPTLPFEGFTIEQPWTTAQNGLFTVNGEMEFLRLARDGRTLAWGTSEGINGTGRLTLFDLERQEVVARHKDLTQYASFSDIALPNDRFVLLAHSSRVIAIDRDTEGTTTLAELSDGSAATIDLTPDGSRLVLGVVGWNESGRVELYDLRFDADGPRLENRRTANADHTHPVKRVVVSRDGKYIASASADGVVIVGDAVTGKTVQVLSLPTPIQHFTELGYALEFSPDSRLLAAGGHRGVVLWDTETWQQRVLPEKHDRGIMALAFSSDNRFIASGTTDGIRIWNVAEGWQAGNRLEGHDGNVITGMAFAKDDQVLITAGFDSRIRFLNLGKLRRSSQAE